MPVNKSLAKNLKKRYGKDAENVYYSMESAGKPAFKKGLKTAKAEGHTAPTFPKKKKKAKAKK